MRLSAWLKKNGARLLIVIEGEAGPYIEGNTLWLCIIQGYPNPTKERPAVFIRNNDDDCIDVEGTGITPNQAFASAVENLSGLRLSIIGQGYDKNLRIPPSLTA